MQYQLYLTINQIIMIIVGVVRVGALVLKFLNMKVFPVRGELNLNHTYEVIHKVCHGNLDHLQNPKPFVSLSPYLYHWGQYPLLCDIIPESPLLIFWAYYI